MYRMVLWRTVSEQRVNTVNVCGLSRTDLTLKKLQRLLGKLIGLYVPESEEGALHYEKLQ